MAPHAHYNAPLQIAPLHIAPAWQSWPAPALEYELKNTIPGEFIEMKGRIVDGLSSRLEGRDDEEADVDYTRQDIDRCDAILMTYLGAVFEPGVHADSEKIMAAVETIVVALNELNDDCDQSLIETEQRDALLELIGAAATQVGLVSEGYDYTEEWREW